MPLTVSLGACGSIRGAKSKGLLAAWLASRVLVVAWKAMEPVMAVVWWLFFVAQRHSDRTTVGTRLPCTGVAVLATAAESVGQRARCWCRVGRVRRDVQVEI